MFDLQAGDSLHYSQSQNQNPFGFEQVLQDLQETY